MITIDDLKKSIYQSDYFTFFTKKIRVTNESKAPQNGQPILQYVDLDSNGEFIEISNKLLKDSANIYSRKEDKPLSRISFKRDCDGICFLKLGEKGFLLFIEVKTGFNEIKTKGLEQLVASYVRTRCLLNVVDTYLPDVYEEKLILISYPYDSKQEMNNEKVIESKQKTIIPTDIDIANQYYATALRVDGCVMLDLKDYHIDGCHLNKKMVNPKLEVIYLNVQENSLYANLTIDDKLMINNN